MIALTIVACLATLLQDSSPLLRHDEQQRVVGFELEAEGLGRPDAFEDGVVGAERGFELRGVGKNRVAHDALPPHRAPGGTLTITVAGAASRVREAHGGRSRTAIGFLPTGDHDAARRRLGEALTKMLDTADADRSAAIDGAAWDLGFSGYRLSGL